MYKLFLQLKIEGFLSHGKPYLASHPELGVPLGVFNTYDEPNYASRVKSIKKLGKQGNSLSLKLAKDKQTSLVHSSGSSQSSGHDM